MPTVADSVDAVIGGDTHVDTTSLSVVSPVGAVIEQIRDYGLADVVDCIDPYGCIMAGDVVPPWRTKRARR